MHSGKPGKVAAKRSLRPYKRNPAGAGFDFIVGRLGGVEYFAGRVIA